MNGLDRAGRRRKSLKERLGLKGLGCCGSTWGFFRPSTITVQDDQAEEVGPREDPPALTETQLSSNRNCVGRAPATPSMNLAAALAAERHYRAAQDTDGGGGGPPSSVTGGIAPGTPLRVSLMRLLEEETRDGGDVERETNEERGGGRVGGSDSVCCVCMGRKKGAAFVPCGHTFCRVCSRELWLNRGSCPLCNAPISQILDIF
ncbi:uncharacterized protein LOC131315230 isoform X2 [Rhododendron vialii]|nr:uncharacterized protein LOC131315230 isoform X2 [Rhododendron vialii]